MRDLSRPYPNNLEIGVSRSLYYKILALKWEYVWLQTQLLICNNTYHSAYTRSRIPFEKKKKLKQAALVLKNGVSEEILTLWSNPINRQAPATWYNIMQQAIAGSQEMGKGLWDSCVSTLLRAAYKINHWE